MTAALAQPEPFEVPEGGLATFLTASEGDWSDKALDGPETGYVIELADRLAGYGREGDTKLAHVAPGETVVPLEVLDADPELKTRLFTQMRDMGLEPERYIVGSELNSLNPATGQPEFFLKKIVKGIKKAVKGVVKVFKKIAPIVLPIALNVMAPGLGAIASGALGSGIGTLVQGGSLKDAFKSALMGGAMGGLASGVSGAMSGQGFVEGVKGGLPGGTFGSGAPTTAPIETAAPDYVAGAETATSATGAPITAEQAVQQAIQPPPPASQMGGVQLRTVADTAVGPTGPRIISDIQGPGFVDVTPQAGTPTGIEQAAGTDLSSNIATAGDQTAKTLEQVAGTDIASTLGTVGEAAGKPAGFFESLMEGNFKEAFLPSAPSQDLILKRAGELQNTALEKGLKLSGEKALEMATKELSAGAFRTYGPLAGLGLGIAGLAGAFETPEMQAPADLYGGMTGSKLLQMYPQQYGLARPGSQYTPITAAKGGGIGSFPRKNGAIYGPGTETSDDVPAMLSDGEFVMTAKAVRGAGNGSRELGMRRMYDLMSKFEGGAVRG